MTHTTTTTCASNASAMGNGNKKFTTNSFSADDLSKHSSKLANNKDVAKWSSNDVQHWVKEQCKKFELKKATVEKFEMNGQALVLLTKHDFLRRSPDGGEVLYYALQRLINPNKVNTTRLDQNLSRTKSSAQHPRIVEISADDEVHVATDPSSPKPIVEEPDDPPIIRRSQSDDTHENNNYQQHRHPFFFRPANMHTPVFTMPAGSAAAYFQQQQQQGFPNAFMYAHNPHLHMHQQQLFHPHFIHQYHPMMSAQGILIEIMDDLDPSSYTPEGVNGSMNDIQGSFYVVTMNGQRYIMGEAQVRQLVAEVHQHQAHQENLQQQQQHFQQQQFQQQQFQQQQQQQQHFQQQQQRF